MTIEGGCYCGAIRYESTAEPEAALQCHCRECQYITGGYPNAIVVFPQDAFRFTQGTPRKFTRTDHENPVTRFFCPTCGTAIGTRSPRRPSSMIVKVGTLDDPSIFNPKLAIFTIDKQHFHTIPDGVPAFERLPG
ncbi:MAG: GFA family protein [Rhodospirillaceae bacterium]